MRAWTLFFLLISGISHAEVQKSVKPCALQLSSLEATDRTDSVIAYIAMLLEENIIGELELRRLVGGQELITENEARVNSAKMIHRSELDRQLRLGKMNTQKLSDWAEAQLNHHGIDKVDRNEVHKKTVVPFRLPKFHNIPAGKFIMKENPDDRKKSKEVTIEKEFQMSDVLVTQWLFAMVTGENPSWFAKGGGSEVVNGKRVEMRPDHPVEWLNYGQVTDFLRKLNDLAKSDDPLIYIIIPDHIKGSRYFRPTEAQWEYVARNLGQATGDYSFDETKLGEYAWYTENSATEEFPQGTSHPVAQKKPMMVAGQAFYDIYGNVGEWCENAMVIRGGNWNEAAVFLKTASRNQWPDDMRFPYAGIRLVRDLP